MKVGYLPHHLWHSKNSFIYPLAGLQLDFNGVWMCGMNISSISASDMLAIEKTDIFENHLEDHWTSKKSAPVFLIVHEHQQNSSIDALFKNYASAFQRSIVDAKMLRMILALRLLRESHIGNPLQYIVYHRHSAASNSRTPNFYGREYVGMKPAYRLRKSDLSVLEGLYCVLDCAGSINKFSLLDRAVSLFNSSYDAIGSSLEQRGLMLLAAYKFFASDSADSSSSPIDRKTRNRLAHGYGKFSKNDFLQLRSIVRELLLSAIYRLVRHSDPQSFSFQEVFDDVCNSRVTARTVANVIVDFDIMGVTKRNFA